MRVLESVYTYKILTIVFGRRQQRNNSPFSQMEAEMQGFRESVRPMGYT